MVLIIGCQSYKDCWQCMPHNRRDLLMSTSPPMAIGTPITTNIAVESSSDGCRKCGIIKKSGKRSCCARGGAWFKRCGDAGDPTKDHTWADGMAACQRKLRAAFMHMHTHAGQVDHKLPRCALSCCGVKSGV